MDPASFLPPHIVDVLKRKSSRDPSSRFCTKLHLLLSYAAEEPGNEDRVGLAWIDDNEFKMNKATLSAVMGIKLNTLNVNLRDLHFTQRQRDKNGWTRWAKSGFTRSSSGTQMDGVPMLVDKRHVRGYMDGTCIGKAPAHPFRLGQMSPQQNEMFFMECQRLWQELMQVSPTSLVDSELFIRQAAARFKHKDQPDSNARDVIKAIIMPTDQQSRLGYADFCRLLAMFGPAETLMLKIQSLLKCSNETGKWLSFEQNPSEHQLPFAAFDRDVPNCLVIYHENKTIDRVYSDPNVTSDEKYLIDEKMDRYDRWADYFEQYPVAYMSDI